MDVMEQAGSEWNQEHPKSMSNSSENLHRAEKRLVLRPFFYKNLEMFLDEAIHK